ATRKLDQANKLPFGLSLSKPSPTLHRENPSTSSGRTEGLAHGGVGSARTAKGCRALASATRLPVIGVRRRDIKEEGRRSRPGGQSRSRIPVGGNRPRRRETTRKQPP